VATEPAPFLTFKVTFAKQTYDITMRTSQTVDELTKQLEELTGVPACMQKLMFKGQCVGESV
jgi:hypothetical protein